MAFNEQEKQIILKGKELGKTQDEVTTALARFRAGITVNNIPPQPAPRPMVQDVAIGAAKGLGETVKFIGSSAAKAAPAILGGAFMNAVPGVKSAVNSGVDRFQEAVGLTDENLTADNNAQLAGKGIEIATEFLSPFVMSRLAGLASKGVSAAKTIVPPGGGTGPTGFLGKVLKNTKEFIANPKLSLAKQNVSPQLESSANRLFLEGTERLKDPIATYEKYLTQSKKALTDIKADPAISSVGETIGDAFKQVVTQRRTVGKIMGEELKKVGHIQTNVLPTIDTFVNDLAQEALTYDRVAKKIVQQGSQSKMTVEDINLLEKYATELQKLGSKPSVANLDAFMSRLPNEIDIYKSSKNITGTTNAERIIKKSLSDLREQFSPTINPAFQGYYDARKQYANLSDFIEEGSGFLGKLTQSGDFAKDASLAKSAVQSILNQGKKDWLNELEELSGYPALDDSVIALQAMKDAGDFRGLSLLEELSKGTPTSQARFTQKVIDYAMAKAGRAVGGTPEEQTRIFLQALKEGAAKEGLR